MNKAILFDCRRYHARGYMMTRGCRTTALFNGTPLFISLLDGNLNIWVLSIKGCEYGWHGTTSVSLLKICLLRQCWNVSILPWFPRPESIKCCHSYSRLCWPCCTCVALCSSQTISLHEKQLGSVFVREASFYLFVNLNDSVVRKGARTQSGAYHDVIGL